MLIMCGDMITIRLSPSASQLNWSNDYAKKDFRYCHNDFRGDESTIFAGMVGERCFGDYYHLDVQEHDNKNLYGHDLVIGDFLLNVKTTQCVSRPLPDFNVAMRADQMPNKTHLYGLAFYNKPSNILTICGWATNGRIFSHGKFQPEGAADARSPGCGTPWSAKHSTWKIQVQNMYPLELLIPFCESHHPPDIPAWETRWRNIPTQS